LQHRGLLENTDVIITSDHGELFGDHSFYGHSYTVYIEEISVPLVILSPVAPAGKVVHDAVSLRDLPATVMDLLGLSAGSPFPGHSLAACWGTAPGQAQEMTSPALSEQAYAATFERPTDSGLELPAAQMSLVSTGHHYIRQVTGAEQLYNLSKDPVERVNLIGTPYGNQWAGVFRKHLLEVLTENPGSVEVERAYLSHFRERLRDLVQGATSAASR
jgi:arylsulfatase A-like enzyme